MPRAYRQLDLDERRTIFRLLNVKLPVAAIAQQLGRHRSTIHRESAATTSANSENMPDTTHSRRKTTPSSAANG